MVAKALRSRVTMTLLTILYQSHVFCGNMENFECMPGPCSHYTVYYLVFASGLSYSQQHFCEIKNKIYF